MKQLEPPVNVRDRLDEAFSPAAEIETPERFAGRVSQLRQAIRALRSERASFLIFGYRGVGKTSFAKQVQYIAAGQTELIESLELQQEVPGRGFQHPTAYFQCTDFVKDVPGLLQAMLADTDKVYGLGKYFDGTALMHRTTGNTLDLGGKFAGVGATSVDSATEQHAPIRGGMVDLFRQLTLEIVEKNHNWPLVLVIDELDRLKDKSGLASLIKAFSHIRFIVVGIAQNFHELVQDHASVERQLSDGVIRLLPMTNPELREIFTKAQSILGQSLVFEADAIDEVVSMANGFPHFVHLIGKEAGLIAVDAAAKTVSASHVKQAVASLVENKRSARYEDLYLGSIRGSAPKEIVLKTLADAIGDEINTTDVYPLCERMGVTNPSQYVGGLVSDKVLMKTRPRYYRFDDELFRTYVRIRGWKFK